MITIRQTNRHTDRQINKHTDYSQKHIVDRTKLAFVLGGRGGLMTDTETYEKHNTNMQIFLETYTVN